MTGRGGYRPTGQSKQGTGLKRDQSASIGKADHKLTVAAAAKARNRCGP